MSDIDRRAFLGLGAALGAAALVGPVVGAAAGGVVGPARPAGAAAGADGLGELPALFADPAALARIGAGAVRARPVGRDRRRIAAALAPAGAASPRWLATASAAELRAQLSSAVAADFAAGRIVDVAGWQLALTEARVAALFFLTR
jgi:hypothetical protein